MPNDPPSKPQYVLKPLGVEVVADPEVVDKSVVVEAIRWEGLGYLVKLVFSLGCLAAGVLLTLAGFVGGSKIVAESAQGSLNVDGPVGLGFLALGAIVLSLSGFSFKAVEKKAP